jgi:hypothetical protein
MRGVSISVMLMIHVLNNWLDDDSRWFLIVVRILTNTVAINNFIFVSGLSYGFSWQLSKSKKLTNKEITNKNISKIIILGFIVLIFNLSNVLSHGSEFKEIWSWFILQTITFMWILGLFFMKFSSKIRIIVAIILILTSKLILDFLNSDNPILEFFYFILFNKLDYNSPVFFLPFFLIGTVMGEKIQILSKLPDSHKNKIKNELKSWVSIGMILIFIGIISGSYLTSNEIGWDYVGQLNLHPEINISGIPMFLVRVSYAWCFYTLGFILLILSALYFIFDYKKKFAKRSIHPFELFGRYSLTVYLTHYIFFINSYALDHTVIMIPVIILFVLWWCLMKILEKYGKGKYSIKYVIGFGSKLIYNKYFEKEKNKRQKLAYS